MTTCTYCPQNHLIQKIINNRILKDRPTQSITAAAFIVACAGIMSRVLGLIRDRILASQFGAGDILDAYYAAFRIPDLLYNFLILGAMSAAFIPVFTRLISSEKEKEGWKLANGVLILVVTAMILLSVLLGIFAPYVMKVITPGFSEEKMRLAVELTRIMFLSPLLLGISAIFGGILVSFKRFLTYSLAPMMYNIGIIIGALFFVKIWGPFGLAWGVVLGALLHLLIQYPAIKFSGYKFEFLFRESLRNENIKKIFYLMLPRTFAIAANQINLLIITIFASTLKSGSLAIFNFANNLQSVPLGVIGVSFAVAAFPALSSFASKEKKDEFVSAFSKTARQIIFLIIPLSAFILILRAQIVRITLGTGEFDWEDTVLTFDTLGILALSLFAQSLVPLLTRSFYSIHDTKTPFFIALGSEIINILLVILLIDKYALFGLAIAFSVSATFNMITLLYALRIRIREIDGKKIFNSMFKSASASLLAGITIQIFKNITDHFLDIDTFVGIFSQLFISASMGALVFVAMCYAIKIEEFFEFKKSITKRLFRARSQITETTDEISGV